MSQAKITNFFRKPETSVVPKEINGSSKDITIKGNKRPANAKARPKKVLVDEHDVAEPAPVSKKLKINEFFNKPKEMSKVNTVVPDQKGLWTSIYRPKSSDQLIGNGKTRGAFFDWLASWHDNYLEDDEFVTGKCAFIYGPSGTGKTSTVYAIASDLKHSVLEFNCSSLRVSPSFLTKEIGESLQSHCINMKSSTFGKSLILLDDFDALLYENNPPVNLPELWRQLQLLITGSQKPIVITSAFGPTVFCPDETMYFKQFKLDAVHLTELQNYVRKIAAKESKTQFELRPHQNYRDARRLINECQFWCGTLVKKSTESVEPQIVSAQQMIQQMDLLSTEDIYQTTLNRLSCKNSELGDYYNSHLTDHRNSLLTTSELQTLFLQCTSKKEENSLGDDKVLNESICTMIASTYLPLTPRNPDYFAFFSDLITLRPSLLTELEQLISSNQNQRRSSRLKRHQKLSFRFL